MPSNPKIPREMILKTALDMLIRSGYETINIKAIAKELQCSTQPISWQFGNMEEFRKELAKAAFRYASDKSVPKGANCVEAFEKIGEAYVDIAFDEPNLIRFIAAQSGEPPYKGKQLSIWNQQRNQQLTEEIAKATGMNQEAVQIFMQTVVVYTHGLAMLIVSGVLREKKETIHTMIRDTGIRLMISFGVEAAKAYGFFEKE